jgi:hypothetical protein
MKLVSFLTLLLLVGLGLFAALYQPTETRAAAGAAPVAVDPLAYLPQDG